MNGHVETRRAAEKILSWGVPVFYFLVAIAFYLRTYDSAQVKITITQMGGIFLVCTWLLWWLSLRRNPIPKISWPLLLPPMCILAWGVVSFLHTSFKAVSSDEFTRRLVYIGCFLILITHFRKPDNLRRLLNWITAAVLVATLYGFIQWLDMFFQRPPALGVDPFIWRQAFNTRVFSTFGNPKFYGSYLIGVMPLFLALATSRGSPFGTLLYGIGVFATTFLYDYVDLTLYGGWVEAQRVLNPNFLDTPRIPPTADMRIFGLFLLSQAVLWLTPIFLGLRRGGGGVLHTFCLGLATFNLVVTRNKTDHLAFGVMMATYCGLTIWFVLRGASVRLKRFFLWAGIAAFSVGILALSYFIADRWYSVTFRLYTWMSTWEMTQQHPVLGTGIGTFKAVYPAWRRPQIFHIEARHNTETDHAENEPIEILYDEGLVGAGLFAWLWVVFLTAARRRLEALSENPSPEAYSQRVLIVGLVTALIAIYFHELMDVAMRFVSSGTVTWLLWGLLACHLLPPEKPPSAGKEEDGWRGPWRFLSRLEVPEGIAIFLRLFFWGGMAFLLLRLISTFHEVQSGGQVPPEPAMWVCGWLAFLPTAAAAAWGMFRLSARLRSAAGFALLGLSLWGYEIAWRLFRADYYHNQAIFHSKRREWDTALEYYNKVVRNNPTYLMTYYFMGNVYNDRMDLTPKNDPVHYGDPPGVPRIDPERALLMYHKLKLMAPNYVQMHFQIGNLYMKLGSHLENAGRLDEAEIMYRRAIENLRLYHRLDPVFIRKWQILGMAYAHLGSIAQRKGRPVETRRHFEEAQRAFYEGILEWGKYEEAQQNINNYRQEYAGLWTNLGAVYSMQGKYFAAGVMFEEAVRLEPAHLEAWRNLALLRTNQNRRAEAIRAWNRYRDLLPPDQVGERQLADAHLQRLLR